MNTISDASLGINAQSLPTINMFPNPVKDYVSFSEVALANDIQVYYLTDKLVISNTPEAPISTINIPNLTSGIYFINIVANSAFHTLKLPKE